jgi:hypothetical protein
MEVMRINLVGGYPCPPSEEEEEEEGTGEGFTLYS